MWSKAHPIGMRVWIMKSRPAEWFAKYKRTGADFFVEDVKMRKFVDDTFGRSGISKVIIRKTAKEWEIIIFSSKVGVLMGKQWEKIKEFEEALKKKFNKDMKVVIKEVKIPELSAKIMAEFIASQLEARMPFRKVAKNVLQKVMEKWAAGIKIQVGGRLGWVDISRSEKFIEGRVSLQTFRSDIDFYYLQARTKYGMLGVKVWIEKGILYNKASAASTKKISL
ncbi:MAG: ribosomal protein S3 [uncultured bacterium (gcode 4)]|uniref:Small ribosomal subunit protein uS3 n=1 Tax=uncultured bacterium (gcode 4) TaxID=1234023 RepID=K1YK69_9BACT|nr:MAG: ribosomal protein S3 [uncultured bacterium (gcode 4)]